MKVEKVILVLVFWLSALYVARWLNLRKQIFTFASIATLLLMVHDVWSDGLIDE